MIDVRSLVPLRAPALAAALAAPAPPARLNLLLNPAFDHTEALGGAFRRPSHWRASAFSPVAGAVTTACPAALTARRNGRGASVAWVDDSLPSAAPPCRPAVLYQTLRLGRGTYRFGGRIALRVWGAALDDAERRVSNASQAFLRLVLGAGDDAAPAGVEPAVLATIDLSPQRFAFGAFRRVPSVGATVRFAYAGFDPYEETVRLDGDGPFDVTLQLGVVPRAPAGGLEAERLVALTQTTLVADHLFVEPV